MPRYRSLETQELPDGVIGARLVQAGDVVTVSDDEALLLEAAGDTWRRLDAPARNRMVDVVNVTKTAGSAPDMFFAGMGETTEGAVTDWYTEADAPPDMICTNAGGTTDGVMTTESDAQITINGVPLDLDAPACAGCTDCQCGGD
jgi:hypothetical protein